jgi:Concanavalin A-like lectin/glucanases superfamily/Subtilase family/WD40-like Beta Propeller Repeat
MSSLRSIFPIVVGVFFAVAPAFAQSAFPDVPRPIALRARRVTPPAGADPAIAARVQRAASRGETAVHLILQLRHVPGDAVWQRLAANGIFRVSYLGDEHYIVRMLVPQRLSAQLSDNLRAAGATALTPLQPQDKVSPRVTAGRYETWAYEPATDLLKVVVLFFPETPSAAMQELLRAFHRGSEPPKRIDPILWAIVIRPADALKLAETESVHDVDVGPTPELPVMHDARWKTGAEAVQKVDLDAASLYAQGFSGRSVRINTAEGFDINHEDFWNHDATGQRTTSRWPSNCLPNGGPHGTMTGGIALGNGFSSMLRNGSALQWRGIAPEALYDCGGTADIVSRSFVQTAWGIYDSGAASIDSAIRGDNSGDLRPQYWAVANQGIDIQYGTEKGYYSVYAPAKNPLVVANISSHTLRWMGSSIGPTFDGRIKPDISAPGTREPFPEDRPHLQFDLDFVKVNQSAGSMTWDFNNGPNAGWEGGWGIHPWWGQRDIGPRVPVTDGTTKAIAFTIKAPPYTGFPGVPMIGTLTTPSGAPLSITGAAADTVEVRYRLEADPMWRPGTGTLAWMTDPNTYDWFILPFDVISDGAWHTVTLPVGKDPNWRVSGIDYMHLRFSGPGMLSAATGGGYTGAGGSSAAAPAVAGASALLMDQMVQKFGIVLGNRTASSPFWFGAPGTGMPLPSTFKALLIHGAQDLASIDHANERNNPDTGQKTVYHNGPDLVTGYGNMDVAESSRVVAAHTSAQPYIVERLIASGGLHTYTINVPASPRGPLKVTLVWDDPAGDPLFAQPAKRLVNNLDVSLVAPNGTTHFPYSIDQPYTPAASAQYPNSVEPEPITAADIHPARQDVLNDRDNVEQVFVAAPQPGSWIVRVHGYQLYQAPQKYSLILGTPPRPAPHLTGGKVVFASDRTTPRQLFVKQVGGGAPVQVTSWAFPAKHPQWSPNGKYILYVTTDAVIGGSLQMDVLKVITEAGVQQWQMFANTIAATSLGYPRWSNDGRSVVVTYWYSWGARGLALIRFASPNQFGSPTVTTLVAPGSPINPGEALFSRDGRSVYFTGDSGGAPSELYRIPAAGGTAVKVYGNGVPLRRVFAPSLSPDGTRLLYNSELWRENPVQYLDEEVLEVGLVTGVIGRVTAEPGNQYAWFAKNGAGETIGQSAPVGGNGELYLEENGVRAALDVGDTGNAWQDHSPDWWKSPCGGGTVIWSNGEAVGCKFTTWGPEQLSYCGAWTPLPMSGNGTCAVCIDEPFASSVLSGAWSGLFEGTTSTSTTAADFSCRACMTPPATMTGWWPLDETTTTIADLSPSGATGTRFGSALPVAARVKGGLRLNGTNAYVEVPSSAPLNVGTGNFSIDAWVRIDSPADLSGVRTIVEKRQQAPWRGYSFFLFNGAPALQLADGLGTQYSNYVASAAVPADSAWHHVAVTVDRANAQGGVFHLDGDPVGTAFNPAGRAGTLDNTRPLRLGSTTQSSPGSLFKGSLDEVELFRRVLPTWEVRMLYLAGPCGNCK